MKLRTLALAISLLTGTVIAHEGIELGPNKGRILELSTNETMHGEVTQKDGKLHIALLDKDMKPVVIAAQEITATAGTREAPEKLMVEKSDKGFVLPAPPTGQWIIVQYKESADAKAIIARLHYNTNVCDPCKQPEWRCACAKE
jgi:hypothetical protein